MISNEDLLKIAKKEDIPLNDVFFKDSPSFIDGFSLILPAEYLSSPIIILPFKNVPVVTTRDLHKINAPLTLIPFIILLLPPTTTISHSDEEENPSSTTISSAIPNCTSKFSYPFNNSLIAFLYNSLFHYF